MARQDYARNARRYRPTQALGPAIGPPGKIGERADYLINGEPCIDIDGWRYRACDLVWFHAHGAWPKGKIQHLGGDVTNNRFANLRDGGELVN